MSGREGKERGAGAALLRRQLERAAAEWRTTFDAIASPVLVLDGRGTIRRLNRAARDVTGLPFTDLVGRSVTAVGGGPLFAAAAALAGAAGRSGTTATETVTDPASGTTWSVVAHPRGAEAEVDEALVIVVASDITRLAALQESVRRGETFNALGAAIAGLAHRVRNPLFGISAALDAFDARFGEQEELRRYAVALREPVVRLANLLEELLRYAGPAGSPTHATDLALVVAAAVRSCSESAMRRRVAITTSEAGRPLRVEADTQRLQNAFIELIENAIQASPPGGRVDLELDTLGARGDARARLRIRDSGPGFPDEDLPRLGEPFFSRRHDTTGLGLAFVRRVLFEAEGRIAFANRTEGGAEVEVLLPLRGDRGAEI